MYCCRVIRAKQTLHAAKWNLTLVQMVLSGTQMFPKIGFYLATKRFVLPPRLLIHLKCHVQLRWNSVLNFKTSSGSRVLSCGLFHYLYHLESSPRGACSLAWKFPPTTTVPLKRSYLKESLFCLKTFLNSVRRRIPRKLCVP